MEYVIFAVAGEGHFTNIGEEYGRAIKIPANDEINAFLDSVVGAKKLTDEEYYEMFPDARPVEEEVVEGEILEGEIESEVIEPTEEDNGYQHHAEAETVY